MGVLIVCILIGVWIVLAGQGGFCRQQSDFEKHNFILKALIEYEWPVQINSSEFGEGTLVYYIAAYILPALAGKISGSFVIASYVMTIETWIGVILVVFVWSLYVKADSLWKMLVVLFVLIGFNTFMPFLIIHVFPT